jgi:ABC-type transport system involved in cytochrome c biogenesis ATPase subunit
MYLSEIYYNKQASKRMRNKQEWSFKEGCWGLHGIKRWWKINLTLQTGDMIWIQGPNGSGKTTLMRIIVSLRTAWKGTLHSFFPLMHSNGQELPSWKWSQAHPVFKEEEVSVGHELQLNDISWMETELIGEENRTLVDMGKEGRVTAVTDLSFESLNIILWRECFRLLGPIGPWDKPISQNIGLQCLQQGSEFKVEGSSSVLTGVQWKNASSGQRKKIRLSQAYGESSPLWIWDEPWNALDIQAKKQLTWLLFFHSHQGGLTLWTSHEQPNALLSLVLLPKQYHKQSNMDTRSSFQINLKFYKP